MIFIFDADAHPDVWRPWEIGEKRLQTLRPFGQDLILMPVRAVHHLEGPLNVLKRHIVVKQIAHRIDEDALRLLPTERLTEFFGDESQIEPLFERVSLHAAEA